MLEDIIYKHERFGKMASVVIIIANICKCSLDLSFVDKCPSPLAFAVQFVMCELLLSVYIFILKKGNDGTSNFLKLVSA